MIRVASDVGGTFTDNLAYDEQAMTMTIAKVATTPDNRAVGTVDGLRKALALQGKEGGDVGYVGHGMTTTTNAVIQRTGARIAFLTNQGFRDLLLIGRQDRPSLFDISMVREPPLVEREDCYTVAGRMDATGSEIVPLDEVALYELGAKLAHSDIQGVAICFLHAYANPAHERRAKQILEAMLPGRAICISTEILAEFREYERASTVVLNTYLVPTINQYLASLIELLGPGAGCLGAPKNCPIMVMEGSGGLMTVDGARARPVHTVLSGPAGGVVASAHVAGLARIDDIVTMDMGGTSTDISLVLAGRPQVTRRGALERIPVRVPVIDINAIGAGGGSLAWIDGGGALRVGPMSAESIPGPACYMRGGTRPTVTDANLLLGRFGPDTKLGGFLSLNIDAARKAVEEHIAKPLDLDVTDAAAGILRVAHATMVRGIRVVSVARGHDPRGLTLVPFGGAGPMHGSPVARDLGIPRVMVPPTPGILCALGMLVSNLRHDFSETHIGPFDDSIYDGVSSALARMRAEAEDALARDGVPTERRSFAFWIEMRYVGQSYELAVPLSATDRAAWNALPPAFHREHESRYGHHDPRAPLEVVSIGVTARGLIDAPKLPRPPAGGVTPPGEALIGTRRIFFESVQSSRAGWSDCRVWQREKLLAGNVIAGPAVIEEVSSTTVLYPGDVARVDDVGCLVIDTRNAR